MMLHMLFGKKDGDLTYWKSTIPIGMFSYYVRLVIEADIKKTYIILPIPKEPGRLKKPCDVKVPIKDAELLKHLSILPSKQRSQYIKKILRKQLDWNYRRQKAAGKEVPVARNVFAVSAQPKKPAEVAATPKGTDDDYRKMLMELSGQK